MSKGEFYHDRVCCLRVRETDEIIVETSTVDDNGDFTINKKLKDYKIKLDYENKHSYFFKIIKKK